VTDFFLLSKIAWFVGAPSHLLAWLVIATGLLAPWRPRMAAPLALVCALAFLILFFVPIGGLALQPLENRYHPPVPPPAQIDGILVLGEGLNGEVMKARGMPGIGADGGTLITARMLAARYPKARIVFSGGTDDTEQGGVPEARVARHVFNALGLGDDRVLYEDRSRSTWENIRLSQALVRPAPGQTWLLVAAAYHMPRAMAVALRLSWRFIPWPSDYLTLGRGSEGPLPFVVNLAHLDLAVHEWLGLAAYRVTGKAD
jgi:uncharacterized SAM-binding protein YcdF (DUF218 family)